IGDSNSAGPAAAGRAAKSLAIRQARGRSPPERRPLRVRKPFALLLTAAATLGRWRLLLLLWPTALSGWRFLLLLRPAAFGGLRRLLLLRPTAFDDRIGGRREGLLFLPTRKRQAPCWPPRFLRYNHPSVPPPFPAAP